jgi:hypothetical protein
MATISEQAVRAVMTLTGGPPPRLSLKEADSQTFKKGELVEINSSGFVAEITASGAMTYSVAYGIAAEDGHNSATAQTDGTEVSVFLITPEVLFEGNVKTNGSNHTLAQTDLGQCVGLYHDTGDSKVYLDVNVTAGANVRVFTHRPARGTELGDTNGRVLFNFLPNWIQFLGTS